MESEKVIDFAESYGVWYGSTLLDFRVLRRDRQTLEIAVLPDGSIEVKAPESSTEEHICAKVKKRAAWIVKQRKWFEQFGPRTPQRQYLGGETHLYLGKRYRLKVQVGTELSVRLLHGYFEISTMATPTPEQVKKQLEKWYRHQATKIFQQLFAEICLQFQIENPPKLQIKSMKTRWGSLSQGGVLTLNSSLIRVYKDCIRYVITHELCHLEHHNHSPDFYKLLSQRMPDWETRKQKLEESLI